MWANLVDLDTLVLNEVDKKYVGADLDAKHWNETLGGAICDGALCGGVDGPRPWAGQSVAMKNGVWAYNY